MIGMAYKNKKNIFQYPAGFTLIEIVVAVAIFATLSTIIAGLLVNSTKAQQRVLASQELIDSVSYNLEYMGRAIRMAKKELSDPPACLSARGLNYEKTKGGNGLKFINYDGVCQEFFLDSNRLYEIKDGGTALPLTPASFSVLSFQLGPDDSWDQEDPREQPRVTLYLEMEKEEYQPVAYIQTTISQRNLNVKY
jgi:prepilin-type N-terminal cleavage/methylation domain-containing protein